MHALRLDRGRFVVVRGAVYPAATARAYEVDLREIGVTLWRAIDRDLKPAYESRTDSERADEDKTGGVLIDIGALLESQHGDGWAKKIARKAAGQVDSHNERGTYGPIRALGIDVVRSQGFAGPVLQKWVDSNSTLIKSIRSSAVPGLRKDIEEAFAKGLRWEDLRDKWVREGLPLEFGTLEGRARVIARTEIGKLNADLTEARQRDLGVTHFVWNTVGDLRVRDDHRSRNGKRYEWDKADKKPGHDPNCRCTASAVLDLDAIEPPTVNTTTAFAVKPKPVAQVQAQVAAKKAAAAAIKKAAAEAKAAAKAQAKAQAQAEKAAKVAAAAQAKEQAAAKKSAEQAAKKAIAAQAAARRAAERAAARVRRSAAALPQPRRSDPVERDLRVPTTEAEAIQLANERVRETAVWENDSNPKLARIAAYAKWERDLLEEVARTGSVSGQVGEFGLPEVVDRQRFFADYIAARKLEASVPSGTITPSGKQHASKGLTDVVRDWVGRTPPATLEAYRDWSGDHFTSMRGIDSQWLNPEVQRAKHLLGRYRLQIAQMRAGMVDAPRFEGQVSRGIDLSRVPEAVQQTFGRDLRTPGAIIDQPSPASWSHKKDVAEGFAKRGDHSYVLQVVTRRGLSIDNSNTSVFDESEGEVLLDRGSFRVLSSTWDQQKRRWYVLVEDLSQ